MDLLDMLDTAPKPKKATLPPPGPWTKGPDPWDTAEGREAAARWGMGDKPKREARPDPSDDVDPWATPMPAKAALGSTDGGDAPWAVEPEARPAPQAEAKPEAKAPTRRMARGRAYDPSVLSEGAVNSAGYGFTRLTIMAAEAYAIGPDDPDAALLALIRAGWAASRAAWGPNTPDVAGLADGRPDTNALLRWLDSPLARDADEAIGRLMPADGTPADRIGRAGRAAARALIAARDLIR